MMKELNNQLLIQENRAASARAINHYKQFLCPVKQVFFNVAASMVFTGLT